MHYALLLLIPFMVVSNGTIMKAQQFGLVALAPAFIGALVTSRPLRLFCWYLSAWLLIVALASMSGKIDARIANDARTWSMLFVVGVVLMLVVKTTGKTETWIKVLCCGAIAQTVIAAMQTAGVDPVFYLLSKITNADRLLPQDWRVGTLGNTNWLAGYLAACLPLLFRGVWKWWAIPVAAVVLLSNTSGAMLSAGVGLVFLWGRSWKSAAVLVAVVFAVLVLDTNGEMMVAQVPVTATAGENLEPPTPQKTRNVIWKKAVRSVQNSPVFGHGPGWPNGWRFYYHNDYLEAMHHFGLFGLALLAWYVATLPRKNRPVWAALASTGAFALTNSPMMMIPSAAFTMALLGLLERDKWQTI